MRIKTHGLRIDRHLVGITNEIGQIAAVQAYGHGVLEPRRIGAGPSYRSNAEEASGRCVLDVLPYDISESVLATGNRSPQHKVTDFA
jgi:hypothetical protein